MESRKSSPFVKDLYRGFLRCCRSRCGCGGKGVDLGTASTPEELQERAEDHRHDASKCNALEIVRLA